MGDVEELEDIYSEEDLKIKFDEKEYKKTISRVAEIDKQVPIGNGLIRIPKKLIDKLKISKEDKIKFYLPKGKDDLKSLEIKIIKNETNK